MQINTVACMHRIAWADRCQSFGLMSDLFNWQTAVGDIQRKDAGLPVALGWINYLFLKLLSAWLNKLCEHGMLLKSLPSTLNVFDSSPSIHPFLWKLCSVNEKYWCPELINVKDWFEAISTFILLNKIKVSAFVPSRSVLRNCAVFFFKSWFDLFHCSFLPNSKLLLWHLITINQ